MEKKIKVIICDDHLLFRQGIVASLSTYFNIDIVSEVNDGHQLMNTLKHTIPDIILLDINMPVMDGIEVLPKIKKEYPDIKVIMLSMHNNVTMISKAIALGADSYLTKSDTIEMISEAINKVYTDGVYFTPLMNKALLKSTQENEELKRMDIKRFTTAEKVEEPKVDTNAMILERIITKLDEMDKRSAEPVEEPIVPNSIDWLNLFKKTIIVLLMAAAIIGAVWLVKNIQNPVAKTEIQFKSNTYENGQTAGFSPF